MRRLWLLLLPLLTACAPMLHIDQIGLHRSITQGGQAQIDAGRVVQVYPNLLAGHRSTHGGVFRGLPALGVGSRFWTTGFMGRSTQEWVVVKRVITTSNSAAQLNGWPLVLQTSVPGGRLLLFCRPT